MSRKPCFIFYAVNTGVSLLLGLCVYGMFRPDTYVSKLIYQMLNVQSEFETHCYFVRNYLSDILWAYALTFVVAFICLEQKKDYGTVFCICSCFEAGIEILQKIGIMSGTFDWWDIILEIGVTSAALLIINEKYFKGEMKMKKLVKWISLLLTLALFAGMAIGSGSDSEDEDSNGEISSSDSESSEKQEVTIEEQVLLDQDGIVITAKEYVTDSIWGDGIKVLIENNTDKDLGISNNALIVNNYMVTDDFVISVAAGKKANETISLYSSDLEAAGIENVGQVEFYFYAYDSETYETCYEWERVTLKTSAYDIMDTTPEDSGEELYNKDGIRVVGKMVDEDSFWGTAVLLYIENTSGRDVTLSCDDISVNGFMVSPLFVSTVYDGKMAIDEMTIYESDLEENGIENIEEIELAFHIYDSESYDTITNTDPITITME